MPRPTPLYLDHNATTPLRPEVLEAMMPFLTHEFGNPSCGHAFGTLPARAIAQAREQVASLLGAHPDEITFTSGGTEASNLALRGVMEAHGEPGSIVTSVIEHPATLQPCRWLARQGHELLELAVNPEGQLQLDEAKAAIRPNTTLITVMHANNETGVMQPIAALAELKQGTQAVLHTDAAQSVGKVPVKVDALGVDLLTVAGHKLYAPKGVGALYVRRGTRLAPFSRGAGHEGGLRPGTENVASIVGLGRAAALAEAEMAEAGPRMAALRDTLWQRLRANIEGLAVHGAGADRLPNTLSLRFPGVSGRAVLEAAPSIAASTGSACHEGDEQASAVILRMGVPPEAALGTVRLSLGHRTTPEQVEAAAEALLQAFRRASQP